MAPPSLAYPAVRSLLVLAPRGGGSWDGLLAIEEREGRSPIRLAVLTSAAACSAVVNQTPPVSRWAAGAGLLAAAFVDSYQPQVLRTYALVSSRLGSGTQ